MLLVVIVTIVVLPFALIVSLIVGLVFLKESVESKYFPMKFKASVMEEIDKAAGNNSISPSLKDALLQCKECIKTAEDAELVLNNLNNESALSDFIREKVVGMGGRFCCKT
jgi:hypothetical protein